MIDFNNFNENISDEMLAAYIDGNATSAESAIVEFSSFFSDSLSEIMEIAKDIHSYKALSDNSMMQSISFLEDELISKANLDETNSITIDDTSYCSFVDDDISASMSTSADDFPSNEINENPHDELNIQSELFK